jgi:hypothetical protein
LAVFHGFTLLSRISGLKRNIPHSFGNKSND